MGRFLVNFCLLYQVYHEFHENINLMGDIVLHFVTNCTTRPLRHSGASLLEITLIKVIVQDFVFQQGMTHLLF